MNAIADGVTSTVPGPGQLVRVRNRRWVVADVDRSGQAPDVLARPEQAAQNLVTLTSVEDDGLGETLGDLGGRTWCRGVGGHDAS